MKIFILEDDKNRLDYMLKIIKQTVKSEYTVETYSNTKDAKAGLAMSNHYDIIFLDYDLGTSIDGDSGLQIAKFITKNSITFNKCIIHSVNLSGAYRIKKELPNSIYLPISSGDINTLGNLLRL
jgi:hypothetical protein